MQVNQPKVSAQKATTKPVDIRVRFTGMTYVATVKGEKGTTSNTINAQQAAEAMVRKLGLAPGLLQVQQNDLINPNQVVMFSHPGVQA